MSVVISVYSKVALREFVLPKINNSEYQIVLDGNIFRLSSDKIIEFEIIDGRWFFKDGIGIKIGSRAYGHEEIKDKSSFIYETDDEDVLALMAEEKSSPFAAFKKYDISSSEKIKIGTLPDNHICYSHYYDGKLLVSKYHAELVRENNLWMIVDMNSSNGTFVNDMRVYGRRVLGFGDLINIWGLRIVFLNDHIAVIPDENIKIGLLPEVKENKEEAEETDSQVLSAGNVKKYYHRPPRNIESLETDPVEIEAPPAPHEEVDTPLFMMIGPAMTMMLPMTVSSGIAILSTRLTGATSGVFMYTGIITAVMSGAIGVFWAFRNMNYAKEKARKEENRRFEAYSTYLIKCRDSIQEKYQKNTKILNEQYPSIESMVTGHDVIPAGLWNRNITHPDYMYHRLGLGDIPFQVAVNIPREKFSLIDDSLSDTPKLIRDSYSTLHNVPVGVDLISDPIIGIIGGDQKKGAYQIAYNLIAQIILQNCYTDIKLAFLTNGEEQNGQDKWSFASCLPHVWSQNKKSRFIAMNLEAVSDVCYDLMQILRQRAEESSLGSVSREKKIFKPHIVLFVEDIKLIESELITKYLYDKDGNCGITTVLMVEKYSDLPNACECIIQNDSEYSGIYDVKTGRNKGTKLVFDDMNPAMLKNISRRLANIEVNELESGGEIPQSVSFLDMYGVGKISELNIADRWRKNRTYETMRSMIGIKSGGQPCFLDLHEKYHGPHGLIAGTTGSGKSETLQTYLLSLAMNFSPDDVGLFIIDYKGGGMGNLFNGLPHVLGQISNLSGNQVRRAMVSIKSENLRRQRVFNENGVNNINAYTRLYKSGEARLPVPHLFIIIDEFAELKREEPDFMRELISVAQVGRSLGVHLILSTQKPSGTVDDNIWSNSKFRLCLRVQDRQDSMDMLHKPDAAYITQAGRGYLQVGNDELYELFQSGWSGAAYDEELTGTGQAIATIITDTGRNDIVGNHMKSKRKAELKLSWIGELIDIASSDSAVSESGNSVIDRIYDTFEERGIDYPRNDYNNKLIKNFIGLYAEAEQKFDPKIQKFEMSESIFDESVKRSIKIPEGKEKTQLDAVVSYLADLTVQMGYQKQQPLWLPVLPEKLYLNQLEGYASSVFDGNNWPAQNRHWELKCSIGLCDDPSNQYQFPLVLNFAKDGNHAVCGIGMSGKSTFLQSTAYSLIRSYSPEYLNLYIIDFSSRMLEPFEGDAHVGGVLYDTDIDTLDKFFHMLKKMLKERKALFRGGNYYQYVAKNGVTVPAVVIMIDNYANFREKTAEKYDDTIMQIARECASNGIYLMLTAAGFSVSEIPSRLRDSFHRTISLEMQDKFAYSDIIGVIQIPTLPETGVAGRGLVTVDGIPLEFQTCLALKAEDDYGRIEAIRSECAAVTAKWKGRKAKPVPRVPEKPVWNEFIALDEVQSLIKGKEILPFGYNSSTADIIGMNLTCSYCYFVSGKSRSGKTNLMRIMMRAAAAKQAKLVVTEFNSDELKNEAAGLGARYIQNLDEYKTFVEDTLIPGIVSRNKVKKEMKANAAEDIEIFERMSREEPVFIFISNFIEYVNVLYSTKGREMNLDGAMNNFLSKGSMLNIYFITDMKWERVNPLIGRPVYDSFIKYKTGIFLGGNADTQTIFDLSGISFKDLAVADKPGCGFLSATDKENAIRVVTPSAKK